MFLHVKQNRSWSSIGISILILSIVMTVVLSFADGVMKGPVAYTERGIPTVAMFSAWVTDFRLMFEQGIYAGTVFFVGAKFFETRTIMTIGFDKLDASYITLRGPDEDNVVWIGHRYGTKLEAEAIAATFAQRLKESAA